MNEHWPKNGNERTIGKILEAIEQIDRRMDTFVTREQFWPVKTLVYGFVAIILVAVVGAMVYTVIPKNHNTPQVSASTQ